MVLVMATSSTCASAKMASSVGTASHAYSRSSYRSPVVGSVKRHVIQKENRPPTAPVTIENIRPVHSHSGWYKRCRSRAISNPAATPVAMMPMPYKTKLTGPGSDFRSPNQAQYSEKPIAASSRGAHPKSRNRACGQRASPALGRSTTM